LLFQELQIIFVNPLTEPTMKKTLTLLAFLVFTLYCYPQFIIYHQHISFESNGQLAVINTGNPNNIWQVGVPHKTFFNAANTPPYAIVTDTLHPYPAGNTSEFDVKLIGPQSCWGTAFLQFVHKYDTDSLHAGGFLEVAYNDSTNFRNVVYDTVNGLTPHWMIQNFYTAKDTMEGGIPCFQGHSDGWISSFYSWLWQMGVKSINPEEMDSLTIRFVFKSNSNALPKEGWMVDDIDLTLYWCTSGIEELQDHAPMVMVAPNPVSDQSKVILSNYKSGTVAIELYDLAGTKIHELKASSSSEINFVKGSLNPGMYFLNIRGSSGESAWSRVMIE